LWATWLGNWPMPGRLGTNERRSRHQRPFRSYFAFELSMPPSPLPERQRNSLEDDIVDFAPLPKGRHPQCLVEGLGQIEAGMLRCRASVVGPRALPGRWPGRVGFGCAWASTALLRPSQRFCGPLYRSGGSGLPTGSPSIATSPQVQAKSTGFIAYYRVSTAATATTAFAQRCACD
jgi:hypothetical protein